MRSLVWWSFYIPSGVARFHKSRIKILLHILAWIKHFWSCEELRGQNETPYMEWKTQCFCQEWDLPTIGKKQPVGCSFKTGKNNSSSKLWNFFIALQNTLAYPLQGPVLPSILLLFNKQAHNIFDRDCYRKSPVVFNNNEGWKRTSVDQYWSEVCGEI